MSAATLHEGEAHMRDGSVGRLLVACVSGDAWRQPSPAVVRLSSGIDAARLALGAEYHGVPGYVRAALLTNDLRPDAVEAMIPAYNRGLLHHLRALSDLTLVGEVLREVGAPYVVVKGPVVATIAHERADLRAYSDLDILIAPPHFSRAVAALVRAGCTPITRAFRALVEVQAGELTFITPSGGTLDLHWHTINSPAVRRAFSVRPHDLVARARMADVGGVPAPVLDQADTIVYVAMHAVLSGAHRLLWIKDVDRLGAGDDIPWDLVAERARVARADLLVALALQHAKRVLGMPVHASVIRQFGGRSPWPWAAQAVGRLSRPEDAAAESRLPSRVAARSTRYGVWSSAAELLKRVRSSGGPHAATPNERPPDPDPSEALADFTAWADTQ